MVSVEVVPDLADIQTGLFGDFPQGYPIDSLGYHEAESRFENLLTTLFRVDPYGHDTYLSLVTRASSHTGSLLS